MLNIAEAHGGQQDNDYGGDMMGDSWGQGHYMYMGGFGFFIHLIFWVLVVGAGYYVYKTRCTCNKGKVSTQESEADKEN